MSLVTDTWALNGQKDAQSITSDWDFKNQQLISGVHIKEVKNVMKENGMLTEIYRVDWKLDDNAIDQIFQVQLLPHALSAWHVHEYTVDRLFVTFGTIKIVLYDARKESPTYGLINEFRLGVYRPAMVIVPPQVWHGIKNLSDQVSYIVNIVDQAYQYEDPDHWRLPVNTPEIPYRF